MNRLAVLLVALCAAGFALASPFILGTLRAAHPPLSPAALLALQAVQTLVVCAVAASAGARFASRAALDAPWLRAIAERHERPPGFGGMTIESAAIGSITAVAVTALALALRSSLPEALARPAPVDFWVGASSAFYGGIVEETIVRWGILTTLLALARRVRIESAFWPANLTAALLFGALHLPALAAARIPLTAAAISYVLAGNAIAGTVFGWIFRRRGLEAAMVAHGAADVWLHAALPALLA